jgi:hypothetical protein
MGAEQSSAFSSFVFERTLKHKQKAFYVEYLTKFAKELIGFAYEQTDKAIAGPLSECDKPFDELDAV